MSISCPSCQSKFTIPTPATTESSGPSADTPKHPGQTIRIELTRKAEAGPPIRPAQSSQQATKSVAETAGAPVSAAIDSKPAAKTALPRSEKAENGNWSDFCRQLEAGKMVTPEQMATALYHELTEVRRRLDLLEERVKLEESLNRTQS